MNKFLIIGFLIFSGCGKKDEAVNLYCGVKDPANDLDWLRIIIKEKKCLVIVFWYKKWRCPVLMKEVFVFNLKSKVQEGIHRGKSTTILVTAL